MVRRACSDSPGNSGGGLARDRFELRLRVRNCSVGPAERYARRGDAPLECPPPEVVPEARERGALALERFHLCPRLRLQRLCRALLALGSLPARELLRVVLREVGAPLALILLPCQIRDERRDQLAPGLPQTAQLVEHQRRDTRCRRAQTPLECVEHLLHALRGTFLLLDEVLEAEDLFLQIAVGLFELRAIAEQGEDPVVFLERDVRAKAELEKAELSQRLHERCGGQPPLLMCRARCSVRDEKR